MRYVCLGYHDERQWDALPAAERQQLVEQSLAYEAELRRSGHCVAGSALQAAREATTLRFGRGTLAITDGPFAETKEQLGGFLVLEARDLNHAIQLMTQVPCMRVGGVLEIRPINEPLHAAAASGNADL
jgi:hypothetical protein